MRAWAWNILIWLDQGVNVFFGWLLNAVLSPKFRFGSPDETLSSVFGKNVRAGACRVCGWICAVLEFFDKGHCSRSIEEDEKP